MYGGRCGSRVEARKVETRDNEKRDVDLLFIEARCQRSPIIETLTRPKIGPKHVSALSFRIVKNTVSQVTLWKLGYCQK